MKVRGSRPPRDFAGDLWVRVLGRGRRRASDLSLRSRFVLLLGAAVAVAIVLVSLAAWLIAADSMRDQVDLTLTSHALTTGDSGEGRRGMLDGSGSRHLAADPESLCEGKVADAAARYANTIGYVQLLRADGTTCTLAGFPQIPPTTTEIAVAAGRHAATLRDARLTSGLHLRVSTRALGDGYAVMVARDLTEIDASLDHLAWGLGVANAVGILLALGTGLVVSTSAIRPVHELRRAAEHIAETEDLTTLIPVRGADEIARLATAFNQMTASLSLSRQRQERLISDASHELRTPLTSLRTNIELLARGEQQGRRLPPEQHRQLLDSVTEQLREFGNLITELTILARDRELAHTSARLDEIATRAVGRAELRGTQQLRASLEPWAIRGDTAALERAVLNILDNAIKFSPADATIDIELRNGEILITDDGPGITAEDQPHVLERFWRSPSSRSLPGSGLGLAIVDSVATQHGGSVTIGNIAGRGARVVLAIPGKRVHPQDPRPQAPGPG